MVTAIRGCQVAIGSPNNAAAVAKVIDRFVYSMRHTCASTPRDQIELNEAGLEVGRVKGS